MGRTTRADCLKRQTRDKRGVGVIIGPTNDDARPTTGCGRWFLIPGTRHMQLWGDHIANADGSMEPNQMNNDHITDSGVTAGAVSPDKATNFDRIDNSFRACTSNWVASSVLYHVDPCRIAHQQGGKSVRDVARHQSGHSHTAQQTPYLLGAATTKSHTDRH